MTELFEPRTVIQEGRKAGLKLFPQHLRMLEVLLIRKNRDKGPTPCDLLAMATDAKTREPESWARTRIPPLRKALKPFGVGIATYRHAGYELYEEEPRARIVSRTIEH